MIGVLARLLRRRPRRPADAVPALLSRGIAYVGNCPTCGQPYDRHRPSGDGTALGVSCP